MGQPSSRAMGCANSFSDCVINRSSPDCVSKLQGKTSVICHLVWNLDKLQTSKTNWSLLRYQLTLLTGQHMAANPLLPLHSRACYNDSVSIHGVSFITSHKWSRWLNILHHLLDLRSIPSASLHSRVSQLLARQTLAGEHVCKFMK